MREIKFRAWDKANKAMLTVLSLHMYRRNKSITGTLDPNTKCPVVVPMQLDEHVVLMQYTGLHDKNGKEIWEGDIVDFRRGERVLYIAFNGGQWNMCGNINNPDTDYRCLDHYVKHDGPIEVIGNIYENPELLKGG